MLKLNNKITQMYNQIMALDFASEIDATGVFSFQLPLSQCLAFATRKPLVRKIQNLKKTFHEACQINSDMITVSVYQTNAHPVCIGKKITCRSYDFHAEVRFDSFVIGRASFADITKPKDVAKQILKAPESLPDLMQKFVDYYEDFLWAFAPAK